MRSSFYSRTWPGTAASQSRPGIPAGPPKPGELEIREKSKFSHCLFLIDIIPSLTRTARNACLKQIRMNR